MPEHICEKMPPDVKIIVKWDTVVQAGASYEGPWLVYEGKRYPDLKRWLHPEFDGTDRQCEFCLARLRQPGSRKPRMEAMSSGVNIEEEVEPLT